MEQRCTCGAILPPDARFCHKCGAPQFAEDIERFAALEAEVTPKPPIVIPEAVAPSEERGLGNLRAVGITMAAAAAAFVALILVSIVFQPAVPLILSAAGFAAARFYSMKKAISAISGAILGSMTGMWIFLIVALGIGAFSLMLTTPEGQQAVKINSANASTAAALKVLQDPHQLFASLLFMFFALILSSAFGGLLAARLGPRNR